VKVRAGVGDGSTTADTIDLDMKQAAALAHALHAAIEAAGADPLLEEIRSMHAKRQAAQNASDEAWEAAAPKPFRPAGVETPKRARIQRAS
jgi:hypothetical protein